MYLVTLKLDRAEHRGCYEITNSSYRDGNINHSGNGWYDIAVIADDENQAIERAKQILADYKNVRAEDFFENTSRPEFWSVDIVFVCPECARRYKGWYRAGLEYCVCPTCRRRCEFTYDESKTESRELTQKLADAFGDKKRIL